MPAVSMQRRVHKSPYQETCLPLLVDVVLGNGELLCKDNDRPKEVSSRSHGLWIFSKEGHQGGKAAICSFWHLPYGLDMPCT